MSLDALERELARQRRRLRTIEDEAGLELRRTYGVIYRRLRDRLKELQAAIDEAQRLGQKVNTSWLVNQFQYQQLLRDIEGEVFAYGRQASEIVAKGQREALSSLNDEQRRLVELASGAPRALQAQVGAQFIGLNLNAVNAFVGFAGDGAPLGQLLSDIAPATRKAAQDAISYGIARGENPRVVAAAFRQAASIPLDRALTISRTEMLRAYRSAALDSYRASSVVTGWIWHAQLDDRTCSACFSMSGTKHENSESFGAHVNCRCAAIPYTKSWKELGFDNMEQFERPSVPLGTDVFKTLPAETQRKILGPGKYELYKSGKVTLPDTMQVTRSKKWGTSHHTASAKQSLANAA